MYKTLFLSLIVLLIKEALGPLEKKNQYLKTFATPATDQLSNQIQ